MVGDAVILEESPETSSDSEDLPPILSDETESVYGNDQLSNEQGSTSKRVNLSSKVKTICESNPDISEIHFYNEEQRKCDKM